MHKVLNTSHSVRLRYRLPRLLFGLGLVVYLIHVPVVIAQSDDDVIPPRLDSVDSAKTIVVNFDFQNGRVTAHTVNLVFGHAPGRIGNPPLLRIDLFDFQGNAVEQFNAWHPLWTFVLDGTGGEHLIMSTDAMGTIAFPFSAAYGTMHVIDLEQSQEILSVDLLPTIRTFCRENPQDPDCRSVANPDIDSDGDVDRDDLEILLQDLGKSVSQSACGARCDLNGDGQISNLDAHELIQLCTRPQCATE